MPQPNDGLFYAREDQPFTLTWKKSGQSAYRLEPVTDLPGTLKVPAPADRLYRATDLPSVLIVASERGGGISHFFNWLLNAGWRTQQFTNTTTETGLHTWKRLPLIEAGSILSTETGTHRKIIIDRPVDEAPTDEQALAAIASAVEQPEWTQSSSWLVCPVRDFRYLKNDMRYSSLLNRGQAFRLPHFSFSELAEWCTELTSTRGIRDIAQIELDNLAKEVKRWIGGQATLTQFFFRYVNDQLASNSKNVDLLELFQTTGKYLRDHKPYIVDRWAVDLRDLLESPTTRHRLETYASGSTKNPLDPDFDDDDAYLFLAGWVGLNPEKQWGIRSLCHRQWAREILRG